MRTIAAAVLSAILVAVALIWVFLSQPRAAQDVHLYTDNPLDMRLLQLDKRSLDEAYHQTLLKLWSVWLQGGAQDPTYFQNGLTNARRAYNQAAKQISDRESILFEREREQEKLRLQQQEKHEREHAK